jgi:radical SAM superfamily enzyme YgiQ (UPF0313 family)
VSFVSPPLGLLYIAAALKKNGHNVSVIDYSLEKLDHKNLAARIEQEKTGLVGISTVTPKIYDAMELAEFIKKEFPEMIIAAGGPHATLLPEAVLKDCPSIDFIVQGEGEFALNALVERLENNLTADGLDGIAFRKGKEIINNPLKEYIADLNSIPMPDRELIDINRYSGFLKTSVSPATTIMTSRGCPYRCIYCSKPVTGEKVRATTPENVIKEIKFLMSQYGIKEIIFYDDSFTINRKRAIKICDLIIKNDIKVKWQCETRVNLVDEELLIKMRKAGCYVIAYGIESGSDRVLKVLKKGVTTDQMKKAVKLTKRAGIQIVGYFMLGIPSETEEEIKETINFAKSLNLNYAQFAVATAFPGTELYKMAKDQNKINEDWSKSIYALGGKPLVSLSDVPIDRLDHYVKKAYRSFYYRPSYILKKISGIRSFKDLIYNLKGFKTLLKIS